MFTDLPASTPRDSTRAYERIQALAVALGLILFGGILKIGAAPYIAFAFAGAFVVFLGSKPSFQDLLKCSVLGCVFGLIYHLNHGERIAYFGSELGTPSGFLGMGAIQVMAGQWIWAKPSQRTRAFQNLRQACFIPSLCVGSMLAVGVAAQLTPQTYDPVIYAFDGKFGWPSWTMGEIFHFHPRLFATCGFVYNSLPLALSTCLALQWQHQIKFPVDLGIATLTLGVIGFLLYQICPVSGPVYLFPGDFPTHIPHVLNASRIHLPPVPRNGMPSLHVAWALLLAWNLRARRALIVPSVFYLTFTILATLGSGEHYLADLLVSPALVLAVQSACGGVTPGLRSFGLAVGSAIVLSWLIAFRTGVALAIPSGHTAGLLASLSILLPAAVAWCVSATAAGVEQACSTSSSPNSTGTGEVVSDMM